MKKISKELELEIIKKYKNGMSMKNLALELDAKVTTVFRVLKRNNIQTRSKGGIERLNEEEIVTLYKSGISSTILAQERNVNVHTITNILEKHGVKRDNNYHNLNLIEDYWEKIDGKDKAYFLGLLITDGNVIGNAVRLSLHVRDKYILEIFSKVTQNENKIYEDTRNCATYGIKRAKWVTDLAKYGVVPNKTLTVEMPLLDDNLMPHLIRGMIDGDGWISKRGQIGFCGNQKTVTQVKDFLVSKLGVYDVKVIQCKSSTLYMVGWGSKKDFKTICEYLYQDKEEFYLQRKFEKFCSVIQGNTEVSSEITKGSETP